MKKKLFKHIYFKENRMVLKLFNYYKFKLRDGLEFGLSNFNHEKKILFIHNPKAAGNSILDFLELRNKGFGTSHSTPTFLVPKALWESYYSIVAVRHPIDRLISSFSYHTKQEYQGVYKKKYPYLSSLSIEEYFQLFVKEPFVIMPQLSYTRHALSNKTADFILRIENLEKDLNELSGILGIENDKVGKKNTSKRNIEQTHMTDEFRNKVIDYYRGDFEAFGYTKEKNSQFDI